METYWKVECRYYGIFHNCRIRKKWSISKRRVAIYCKEGRFKVAILKGNMWLVPSNVEKPQDPRKERKNK